MLLTEKLKSFFAGPSNSPESSQVNPTNVQMNLSDENGYLRYTDFFDYESDNNVTLVQGLNRQDIILKQMSKIQVYRQTAMNPDVNAALDIITNEIIFGYEGFPLKLHFNEENQKVQEAVQKAFDDIVRIGNFEKNLFSVVKQSYIDGQLILHCAYDEKNPKKGIKTLRKIDPCGFYYDPEDKKWKYTLNGTNHIYYMSSEKETYMNEEIVRVDFGLYEDYVCLSYLEYSIKIANMLKCMEDLLIPLRFSRSISRRVFNVDVGDLPGKRAEEYMKETQQKFKYKKFYNNDTGEVTNQQHITSMVEDYWFANRGGGKGTTVDLLDESGNLGELGDILYFARKLYRSMNIPRSKLSLDPEAEHVYSYEATDTTQDDIQFMMFISRIRQVFTSMFTELLKRQVISTGIMRESDWNERSKDIKIEFTNENLYIEKMKLAILQSKVEIFQGMEGIGGKVYPWRELIEKIFGKNEAEIDEMLSKIDEEKRDPKLKAFYGDEFIEEEDEPEDDLGDEDSGPSGYEDYGMPEEGQEDLEDAEAEQSDEDSDTGASDAEDSDTEDSDTEDSDGGTETLEIPDTNLDNVSTEI